MMTNTELRIVAMAHNGVDIDLITAVLRSEGIPDADIRDGYDRVAQYSTTEIIRGQYYIRIQGEQ